MDPHRMTRYEALDYLNDIYPSLNMTYQRLGEVPCVRVPHTRPSCFYRLRDLDAWALAEALAQATRRPHDAPDPNDADAVLLAEFDAMPQPERLGAFRAWMAIVRAAHPAL